MISLKYYAKRDVKDCNLHYLINSDQNKHRTMLVNLNSQKSLKNDQCPNAIVGRHNVLSDHKITGEFKKNNKKINI